MCKLVTIISFYDRLEAREITAKEIAQKCGTTLPYIQSVARRLKEQVSPETIDILKENRSAIESGRIHIKELRKATGDCSALLYYHMAKLGIRFPEAMNSCKKENILAFSEPFRLGLIDFKTVARLSLTVPDHVYTVFKNEGIKCERNFVNPEENTRRVLKPREKQKPRASMKKRVGLGLML